MLWDFEDIFLVLHVYRHKFIADLWSMLSVVHKAELLGLNFKLELWVVVQLDAFGFNLLAPAILVQALSEEDNVGKYRLVVVLVNAVAHPVKIESKDLINQHLLTILVGELVVVSLPILGLGVLRQSWNRGIGLRDTIGHADSHRLGTISIAHGWLRSICRSNNRRLRHHRCHRRPIGHTISLALPSSRHTLRLALSLLTSSLKLFRLTALSLFLLGYTSLLFLLDHRLWLLGHADDSTVLVEKVRELLEMLIDGVLQHLLPVVVVATAFSIWGEDGLEDLLKATKNIHTSSLSFRGLEEVLSSWIKSLVRILSWSSSASSASWWISELTIWSLGVLLLHVSI